MAILLLILIYLAFISLGLPDSMIGASWPAMQPEYAVPYSYAGILSITGFAFTILSSFFSVKVIRRFGTGRVMIASVLLTAIALFGISSAPSFYLAIAFCIPLGLGGGCVDAGLNAFVAEHYKSRHMSWLHCFWGVGAMIGPAIMSRSIQAEGWRSGFFAVSSLQFALCIILLFSLPLWKRVAANSGDVPTEQDGEPQPTDDKGMFYVLRIKGVKSVLFSFLFYCAAEATMGLWGASFMTTVKGASPAEAAQWVSFFFLGITIGRFVTGFATIKLRNTALIRLGEGIILAGILLVLLPLPVVVNAVGFILIGLGCAPIFPCMLHETPARFGKQNARVIMSFQLSFSYIGCTVMPPLFGVLAQNTTFLTFAPYLLICILLLIVCTERIHRIARQVS